MSVPTQWPVAETTDDYTNSAIPFPAVAGGEYGAPRDGGSRVHKGYDFAAPDQWSVQAIADGRVFFRPPYIDNGDELFPAGYAAGGHQVWIQHDGFMSRYMHLTADSPNYVGGFGLGHPGPGERPIYYGGEGQVVKRGDYIGTVGSSGWTAAGGQLVPIGYAPHLHLEIVPGAPGLANTGIDPIPFITEGLEDMPLSDSDIEKVAQAVWGYSMHGGDALSDGNQIGRETAGERLRQVRRSTGWSGSRILSIFRSVRKGEDGRWHHGDMYRINQEGRNHAASASSKLNTVLEKLNSLIGSS